MYFLRQHKPVTLKTQTVWKLHVSACHVLSSPPCGVKERWVRGSPSPSMSAAAVMEKEMEVWVLSDLSCNVCIYSVEVFRFLESDQRDSWDRHVTSRLQTADLWGQGTRLQRGTSSLRVRMNEFEQLVCVERARRGTRDFNRSAFMCRYFLMEMRQNDVWT